jgi:hypothetical protein
LTIVVDAASGFNKITEFGYWLSQFVGLVARVKYRLVIHDDSVAGGLRCGYEERLRRALRNGVRPYETSWSLQSLTTGAVAAASSFDEVTEFGFLSSHSVGLVPSDENRLVIHDCVAGVLCFGYGDGPATLYAAEVDFLLLTTAGNSAQTMSATKSKMTSPSQTQPGR